LASAQSNRYKRWAVARLSPGAGPGSPRSNRNATFDTSERFGDTYPVRASVRRSGHDPMRIATGRFGGRGHHLNLNRFCHQEDLIRNSIIFRTLGLRHSNGSALGKRWADRVPTTKVSQGRALWRRGWLVEPRGSVSASIFTPTTRAEACRLSCRCIRRSRAGSRR
jgi:hypothetical protein